MNRPMQCEVCAHGIPRDTVRCRKHATEKTCNVELSTSYTPPESCPKCGGYIAVEGDEYPHCAQCGWEDYSAPNPKIPVSAGSSLSSMTDMPLAGLSVSRERKP